MKISELPVTTTVTGSEVLPIVQSGTTKKVTIADALAGAGGGVGELNGLTGNLSITSTDNSVSINASGTDIDLSVSGGGGVNPTDTFMPVNSNGTFTDAPLQTYDGTTIQTVFGAGSLYFGWSIDLNLDTVVIGDYNDSYDGTKLVIGENTGLIFTRTQSLQSGYNLNFNTETYIFGDWENNDGVVLASSSYLFGKSTANIGVNLDFSNQIYSIGNYSSNVGLKLDVGNAITSLIPYSGSNVNLYIGSQSGSDVFFIATSAGQEYGIKLNGSSQTFSFGDFDGWNNGTAIIINDNTQNILISGAATNIFSQGGSIETNANDGTVIIGDTSSSYNGHTFGIDDNNGTLTASTTLLTNTSGSSSGQHLKIKVGATDYVIELKNP